MRVAYLVILLAMSTIACTRSRDTLSFNLVSETIQLDWNKANDNTSAIVLDNIMEGLTSYAGTYPDEKGEHLRPLPALASSWSIANEGRRYSFHLRENVRWSDGEPLRAQHFVDSWKRLLNPATKSASSYHLFDIVRAQEYAQGIENDFTKVAVRAEDDRTLVVELKRASPYFLHLLATSITYPIRKDLIEKYGSAWTNTQNLVTLGPYTLKDMISDNKVILAANPDYWQGSPAIKTVVGKMISEPLTALTLYVNNELDILPRELPTTYHGHWSKQVDYRTGAKFLVNLLVFNQRKPPFDRLENRKAFAAALNRLELAEFFKGSQTPSTALIPPSMFAHMPKIGIDYDAAVKPKPWKHLRLRFHGSDSLNLMFQRLQSSYQSRYGIEFRLEPLEWKEYKDFLGNAAAKSISLAEQPELFYLGWVADFPDPHSFMNLFTSTSDSNYAAWKNGHYDTLVEQASETTNEARRLALYEEAQRLLLEKEIVVLPFFSSSHQALVKPNIKGVVLNPLDKWYFKTLSFSP